MFPFCRRFVDADTSSPRATLIEQNAAAIVTTDRDPYSDRAIHTAIYNRTRGNMYRVIFLFFYHAPAVLHQHFEHIFREFVLLGYSRYRVENVYGPFSRCPPVRKTRALILFSNLPGLSRTASPAARNRLHVVCAMFPLCRARGGSPEDSKNGRNRSMAIYTSAVKRRFRISRRNTRMNASPCTTVFWTPRACAKHASPVRHKRRLYDKIIILGFFIRPRRAYVK